MMSQWSSVNISEIMALISQVLTQILQETGIKTIPIEKKCKKAKWLSGEGLQIAVRRTEAKSRREKERYKHQSFRPLESKTYSLPRKEMPISTITFFAGSSTY